MQNLSFTPNLHALLISCFGSNKRADARLIKYNLGTDFSTIEADIFGEVLKYQIALPGRHWALNSLAVLAAVKAVTEMFPRC